MRRSANRSRRRTPLAFQAQMKVSMTFTTACVNSLLRFPALLRLHGAEVPSSASLMRAQIVPAQPPHFGAQPSDA